MAFTEFCCRSGGSNLNAGTRTGNSTVPGTAADLTYASGTWVSATGVFTVAAGDPVVDGVVVGDFASVYADGATVTTLVGRVTARTSTTITVSTSIKTGTTTDGALTRTLKIGGAWAGPSGTDGFPLSFLTSACTNASTVNRINMKNDVTYSITAAITGSTASVLQGFTTAYEDGGKAIIDGGTTGASYVLFACANPLLADMIFQNNGATGSAVGLTVNNTRTLRVVVHDVRGNGFSIPAGNQLLIECEAYNCNVSGSSNGGFNTFSGTGFILRRCIAHNNTGVGFNIGQVTHLFSCIGDSNTTRGAYNAGFLGTCNFFDCDFYNNGTSGLEMSGNIYVENCNFIDNGGWGLSTTGSCILVNCGFGSGTAANTSGTRTVTLGLIESGTVTYAADVTPWVDPANGDFRISLSAAKGAGRGAFTQTAPSYSGTVGYPDIGAAQHQDSGGGGGIPIARGMHGGMR